MGMWLSVCVRAVCVCECDYLSASLDSALGRAVGVRRSQSAANLNLLMSNGLLLSIAFTGYHVRCFSCSPPENVTKITTCTVLLTYLLYVPSQTVY